MLKPTIVTFYSFRGGVGRSMSMLNVGCLLAQSGRRVLLVDFDLEAPGLTHLIDRQEFLKAKPAKSRKTKTKGLVDILHTYLFSPEKSILNANYPRRTLNPFIVELDVPQTKDHYGKGGSLHLMPAGHTGHYEKRLDQLNMSSRKFKEVRKAFATRFRDLLLDSRQFDYIFIDARTGFSDEGYISAKFLCDHLIVLSGLNDQNIKGTAEFLTKIAAWKKEKHGPDRFFLVASPVCEYEDDRKLKRYSEARKILKTVTGADMEFTLSLPYHPRLALYEELVAIQWPESGLGRAYRELERMIRYVNEDAASHWVKRARDATELLNVDAFTEAIENIAAIDREKAVELAQQTSVSLARLSGDEARKALPILEASAKIDPGEPWHPLQAARIAINAKLTTREVMKHLDHAEKLARIQDNSFAIAAILHERAGVLVDSDPAAACDNALEAFKIGERLEEPDISINALLLAAKGEETRHDFSAAVSHAKRALFIARKASSQNSLTLCLSHLARLYLNQNNFAVAREVSEELLEITHKSGNRSEVASTLFLIGRLDNKQGHFSKAQKNFIESLRINRELSNSPGIAESLRALGYLDLNKGNFAIAHKQFKEALRINQKLHDDEGIAHVLQAIGLLERYRGDYIAARKKCETSLKLWRKLKDTLGQSYLLQTIADIDRLQGKYTMARKKYEQALNIDRELASPSGLTLTLHAFGEFERLVGNYSEAIRAFDEALTIHRKTGFAQELALIRTRAEAAHVQMDSNRKLTKLRTLVKKASNDRDVYVSTRAFLLLGSIERERGLYKHALEPLNKVLEKTRDRGMKDIMAFSQAELALCLSSLGQTKDSVKSAKAALKFFKEQNVRYSNATKLRKIAGKS